MPGWFWRRLGRGDQTGEVERELAFHLEMRAREFEGSGLSPEEARRAAESSFGDVGGISQALVAGRHGRSKHRMRKESLMGTADDLRRGVRQLRRSPGFATAVGGTVGAGVALVVMWATIVHAYLVRPLPFPDADRLVMVRGAGAPDWREVPDVFDRAVSWDLDALSIVGEGRPVSVATSWVTADYFEVTGARPALGRFFQADEAGPGGSALAVISHTLWQSRWGGDPGVLGQTFTAYSSDRPEEAEIFTVIGVLPADFWFLNRFTQVLAPLRTSRSTYMATLRPGVSIRDAQARLIEQATARDPERAEVELIGAQEAHVEQVRPVLVVLAGAVFLVLAIAVANASSLVLVRAMGREREFAVRAAVGAGRGRLARQLLAEGLLLSIIACATGLVIGWLLLAFAGGLLPGILGTPVPGGDSGLKMGLTAVTVAAVLCGILGGALGMIPVIHVWRRDVGSILREGGRGTGSRRQQRVRGILVAAELALSLTLALGAGLLVRSALHLQRTPLGFEPDGLVAMGAALRRQAFPDAASRLDVWNRVEAAIERDVPGTSVALVGWAPMARSWSLPVETPERQGAGDDAAGAFLTPASSDYFSMLGIQTLRGRVFESGDRAGTEPVAVVSETLARRLWPGTDPLGQRIRLAPDEGLAAFGALPDAPWRTVVGVVADVRKTLVADNPPDLYFAVTQAPPWSVELVINDATGAARLEQIRTAVWSVNPEIPLDEVRWLDEDVAAAMLPSRFLAWLVSVFGAFALTLAALGIYGVVAYAVSQGRRDAAIRIALGATGATVTWTIVARAAAFILAGIVAGLAGGWALSSTLRSQLYGVSPFDGLTWFLAALAVAATALFATWLPARRAARTEPIRALQDG